MINHKAFKKSVCLLACLIPVLSACSSTKVQPGHEVRVEKKVERLDIINDGIRPPVLGASERSALQNFASDYKKSGEGSLTITYPGIQPYLKKSRALAEVLAQGLEGYGVHRSHIAFQPYRVEKSGEKTVTNIFLFFSRYYAHLPDCSLEKGDWAFRGTNNTTPDLGCVTLSNLAAMVADPRNLLVPRTATPPDTGRRDVVLERYRQGQATDTQRSDQERAAVRQNVAN